jgi:hypothetical protein
MALALQRRRRRRSGFSGRTEARLAHFRFVCIGAFFMWLSPKSQKRSFDRKKLSENSFYPLPLSPHGDELIDITSEHRAMRNHQPKSRIRENSTSGSVSLSRCSRLRST